MSTLPFIHLFKTKNNNYIYDVNSNEIVRLNDITNDYLHLLVAGLDESDINKTMCTIYTESDIERVKKGIKESQKEKYLFSSTRPQHIEMFCCTNSALIFYDRFISQFTLEVTKRCNMRCRYCVYSDM